MIIGPLKYDPRESIGSKTRNTEDRSITYSSLKMDQLRVYFSSSDGTVCTRLVMTEWPPICVKVWVLPYNLRATRFSRSYTTTTFDHGRKNFQTTETSGERSLLAGCGHRGHESCQGDLECDTGQGHIRHRQYSSNNDQGRFSPLLRWCIPGSRMIRTQWPTNPTTSSLG